MMPFLLAEIASLERVLPLYVYCVGNHEQKYLSRQTGYPAHQLFMCRNGSGVFDLGDQGKILLTEGSIMILPANTPHAYYPDDSEDLWDLGFVAFQGEASSAFLSSLEQARQPMRISHFAKLWEQLEELWHLINRNGEEAYWEASRRLYDMLLFLLQDGVGSKKTHRRSIGAGAAQTPQTALSTAMQLIHEHYHERLLLANVARAAGYSVQHFHRLFVASYGITPQQYLLQLRMRRSIQLFEEQPGVTVDMVAHQLGMDTSYFIRMFKRTYGKTPKQYIKHFYP